MKITKAMKDAIVLKVLYEKFPKPDISLTTEMMKEAYLDSLPALVKDAWENHPMFFQTRFYIGLGEDEDFRRSCSGLPGSSWCLHAPDTPALRAVLEEEFKQEERRSAARYEIESALVSITTLKQLETFLPELVKYLPAEANTAIVPVAQYEKVRSLLG